MASRSVNRNVSPSMHLLLLQTLLSYATALISTFYSLRTLYQIKLIIMKPYSGYPEDRNSTDNVNK